MDAPDNPFDRSPKREIQGPRPAPLRLHKDSHKIRKPPVAPPPAAAHPHYAQPRQPVIIYTVSPKIIHANPNEFMSVVQRLTGPNSTTINPPASASSSSFQFQEGGAAAISPAARLASIEKTKPPDARKTQVPERDDMGMIDIGIEIGSDIQLKTSQFPGILSPNPNSLPSIPQNFFSPPSDSNPLLGFLHEFSPFVYSNRNYNMENNFIFPSPSTLFSPQTSMPSPNTIHLLNTLFDL